MGVGYPRDAAFVEATLQRFPVPPTWTDAMPRWMAACTIARAHDLTLPTSAETLAREHVPGMFPYTPEDVGGLPAFLEMLEQDVKPRLAETESLDPRAATLFGHSLGGLAVLGALFSAPGCYGTYVAASPSIWWGDHAVLALEAGFPESWAAAGMPEARVLITVGAGEGTAPPIGAQLGVAQSDLEGVMQRARMTENAKELAVRLQAAQARWPGLRTRFRLIPDLDHGLSVWPALAAGLACAFQEG